MNGNQSMPMEVSVASPNAEIPRLADELENRCSALEEITQLLQGKLTRVTRDPEQDDQPALANPPGMTGLGVDLGRTADRTAEVIKQLHDLYERLEL